MWINHNIKASDHVFLKLTESFQTRLSFNPACLAQTFTFLMTSIGAILFVCKLKELMSLGRIVKILYLLSYNLTDKSQLYFILY